MGSWVHTYGTGRRIREIVAYMVAVALIGLAHMAGLIIVYPLPDLGTTFLYVLLGMIGEHLSVPFSTGNFISLGDQVAFAALWQYGPPLAILCLTPPVLVQVFTKKKAVLNSLFNSGQYTLSIAVAGLAVRLASALPGSQTPVGQVLRVFLMVTTFDFVNNAFVSFALALDQEQPWFRLLARIGYTERKNSLVLWYLINMACVLLATYMGRIGVLFMFAGIFALWAQLKFERELERKSVEANTDVLTGLYNVRYLEDWLSKEFPRLASQTDKCSLVFVDVDGLKEVNDTFGHDAGDAVLVHLARVLKSVIRADDKVVRYGGDEFILICGKADLGEASRIGKRVLEAIEQSPATHQGVPLDYGVSLGVASFPRHSTFGRDLVRMADKAMYLAKKSGGNTVYTADSL